jgi:multiple sugar transport system substrate-binding protein
VKKLLCSVALLAGLIAGPALADSKLQLVEVITSPQRTDLLKQQVTAFEQANPASPSRSSRCPGARPSRSC